MSCNQTRLLRHLVVENPSALKAEPWRLHISGCEECRAEKDAFNRSLAVFRQIEAERREERSLGPSWETFSRVMEKDRRSRKLFRLRMSVTAAAAAMLIVSGGYVWQAVSPLGPQPAKIVRLLPSQRMHLMRVMQSSLVEPSKVRFVLDRLTGQGPVASVVPVANKAMDVSGIKAEGGSVASQGAFSLSQSLPSSLPLLIDAPASVRSAPMVRPAGMAPSAGISGLRRPTVQVPTR